MDEVIKKINQELIKNGVNNIDSLINSGIQLPIIFNLLYNNSNTFSSMNKDQMKQVIEYINSSQQQEQIQKSR